MDTIFKPIIQKKADINISESQKLASLFKLDSNKKDSSSKNISESQKLASLFKLDSNKKDSSSKNISESQKLASLFKLDPNKKDSSSKNISESQKLASLFKLDSKKAENTDTSKKMQNITDILMSDTKNKTSNLIKKYGISFISNWLATNWKPILWNIAYSVATIIAITCAYVFITSSSWMLLLSVLKQYGVSTVPGILLSSIKKSGIDLGINTSVSKLLSVAKKSTKIRNILEKQVPQGYLKNVLESLGCNTTNLNVEHIVSNVVNNSVSLASSMAIGMSLQDFLLMRSVGLVPVVAIGGYNIVKKTINTTVTTISKLKLSVERVALSGEQNAQKNIINNVVSTSKNIKITKSIDNIPQNTEKEIPIVAKVLKENNKIAFAGTAAITLISLALANNTNGISELVTNLSGSAIEKGFETAVSGTINLVKESDLAKSVIISTLINKVGINKIIDVFSDKLTQNDREKIVKWSEALKTEKSESLTNKIFRKIMGGDYLDVKTLKGMSLDLLVKKYKKLRPDINIDKIKKISAENLRQLIYEEQLLSQQKLTSLLSSAISTTLKTAVITGSIQAAKSFTTLDNTNKEIKNVEEEMLKNKFETVVEDPTLIKEASKAQAELKKAEFRNLQGKTKFQTETEDPTLIKEASKIRAQLLKSQFKEAQQKAEVQKGLEQRKISLEQAELLKELGKVQTQSLKAQFKEKQKAQSIINEEQKNIEIQRRLQKLEQIAEKHKLKNAAQLEDIAQKLGVVIVNDQGTAFGIPTDDILLNPDLQKSLDFEFTPLAQKIALETAKATTSWLPGVGWIQSTINQINLSLDITEQLDNIVNTIDVIKTIKTGGSVQETLAGQETLKSLLKIRLSSISTIVEEIIKTDKLSAKHVVLQALKDKILYGWDDKTVAREIAKKFLGTGEYSQKIAEMVGESFLNALF